MRKSILKALSVTFVLSILSALPALGQPAEEQTQSEVPEATYRLKRISLAIYGGRFSGGTFLELPRPWERTMVAEGSNEIYQYDGTVFENEEMLPLINRRYYDTRFFAPIKKIEPGTTVGGRIAFYLSEQFHMDLRLSVSKSKATTTLLYDNPSDLQYPDPIRLLVDEDKSFKSYQMGVGLAYDLETLKLLGITPYIGCGFGGIINRFSYLEDKTALYFQTNLGLSYHVTPQLALSAAYMATMFNFKREELFYGKQVTYGTAVVQLNYIIDMVPGD